MHCNHIRPDNQVMNFPNENGARPERRDRRKNYRWWHFQQPHLHSCPQLPAHQAFSLELAETSNGFSSPFLVGCHSTASRRFATDSRTLQTPACLPVLEEAGRGQSTDFEHCDTCKERQLATAPANIAARMVCLRTLIEPLCEGEHARSPVW